MGKNILFYLSTCDTCKRIMNEWSLPPDVIQQDIKSNNISELQLEHAKKLAGSYEALFSKLARKFRADGHHLKTLNEEDYKRLILEEYTFLKRPVLIFKEQIFIGNAAKVVMAAKTAIHGK